MGKLILIDKINDKIKKNLQIKQKYDL